MYVYGMDDNDQIPLSMNSISRNTNMLHNIFYRVKFYDSFESNKAFSGFHDSLAEPSSTSWLGPNVTRSDGLLRAGSTSRHEHNAVASRVRIRIVAFFITSAAVVSVLYLRNNNR